jgi:hypothetical protein
MIMGGMSKRKVSEAQGLLDVKGIKTLAKDLNNLCATEYSRRLSGHIGITHKEHDTPVDLASQNEANKEKMGLENVSNFFQTEINADPKRQGSFIKRERLNSAFKKYDGNNSVNEKKNEVQSTQGGKEPTFGATSKRDNVTAGVNAPVESPPFTGKDSEQNLEDQKKKQLDVEDVDESDNDKNSEQEAANDLEKCVETPEKNEEKTKP